MTLMSAQGSLKPQKSERKSLFDVLEKAQRASKANEPKYQLQQEIKFKGKPTTT